MIICMAAANDTRYLSTHRSLSSFINSPGFFLPLFTLMLHAIFNVLRAPIQMLICIFYSSKFFTTIGAHFSSLFPRQALVQRMLLVTKFSMRTQKLQKGPLWSFLERFEKFSSAKEILYSLQLNIMGGPTLNASQPTQLRS